SRAIYSLLTLTFQKLLSQSIQFMFATQSTIVPIHCYLCNSLLNQTIISCSLEMLRSSSQFNQRAHGQKQLFSIHCTVVSSICLRFELLPFQTQIWHFIWMRY